MTRRASTRSGVFKRRKYAGKRAYSSLTRSLMLERQDGFVDSLLDQFLKSLKVPLLVFVRDVVGLAQLRDERRTSRHLGVLRFQFVDSCLL